MTSPLTAVTYFAGGGLATIGMSAAGFDCVGAVEFNPNPKYGSENVIADWYVKNIGKPITCKSVVDVDHSPWIGVDLFQCSPPCPNFSIAKTNRAETADDLALAEACARFVRVCRPKLVILENVGAYQYSESFKLFCRALEECGYFVHFDLLNAADFGVPQNRRRLILRAVLGGLVPSLPSPIRPHNGWYAAVEDLLPGCPDSTFADWQLMRLAPILRSFMANTNMSGQAGENMSCAREDEPAFSVTTGSQGRLKAFIAGVGGEGGDLVYLDSEPTQTISSSHSPGKYRAFLAHPDSDSPYFPAPADTDPSFCVGTFQSGRPKAFLHMTSNCQMDEPTGTGLLEVEESANTACSNSMGSTRAYLVGDQHGKDGVVMSTSANPAMTIDTRNPATLKAWLAENGRTVSMTSRCLGRFQSVPDWYEFPANNSLAGRIIGNGAPCLLMQTLAEGMKQAL